MDPQETWRMLLRAWVNREWEEVAELAESLLKWIRISGFPPEVEFPKELGNELNGVLSNAACNFLLQRAKGVLSDTNGIPSDVAFSLCCSKCKIEGPVTYDEAIENRWSCIEYIPNSCMENFWGLCPACLHVNG